MFPTSYLKQTLCCNKNSLLSQKTHKKSKTLSFVYQALGAPVVGFPVGIGVGGATGVAEGAVVGDRDGLLLGYKLGASVGA